MRSKSSTIIDVGPRFRRLPPLHAGEVLREEFLLPLKLSPYALAKALGVLRTRVERLVREETALNRGHRIAVVSLLWHDRGILDESASRPRVGGC
jgi:addiction module HigA family antidote